MFKNLLSSQFNHFSNICNHYPLLSILSSYVNSVLSNSNILTSCSWFCLIDLLPIDLLWLSELYVLGALAYFKIMHLIFNIYLQFFYTSYYLWYLWIYILNVFLIVFFYFHFNLIELLLQIYMLLFRIYFYCTSWFWHINLPKKKIVFQIILHSLCCLKIS